MLDYAYLYHAQCHRRRLQPKRTRGKALTTTTQLIPPSNLNIFNKQQ